MNAGIWRVGLIVATLAACAGPSVPMKTYVLGDRGTAIAGTASQAGLPVFELSRVTVPDYLDTTDILRRAQANEVIASRTGRWGERLSRGITTAVARALSGLRPGVVIATEATDTARARIVIDIERFDIGADGKCLVAARWRIVATDGWTTLSAERGLFTEDAAPMDDAAAAAAMTRLIDQLAGQIAAAMS